VQFDSFVFFEGFLLVYLLYLALPHRAQNLLLLAASYVFYGWFDERFLLLLAFTTGVDFFVALRIDAARRRGGRGTGWLALALTSNLGVLGYFKYFGFFAGSFEALARSLGWSVSPTILQIALPAGISFYTFQSMAYTIDVYRGRFRATASLLDFALFIAFFPQLVAGPIERARRLLPQIASPRRVTRQQLVDGLWFILWGLFKKIYVADNLADYVAAYADPSAAAHGPDVLLYGIVSIVFIYADFSGYSDMAVGLAKLMGVELTLNFRRPMWATSPGEFWRRWHVTLTGWFRDYVYGFARGGGEALGKAIAVVPTMLLVGLWHGAGWGFVLWGAVWGLALFAERLLRPLLARAGWRNGVPAGLRAAGGLLLVYALHAVAMQFFMRPVDEAVAALRLVVAAPAPSAHFAADLATILFFLAPVFLVEWVQRRTDHMEGRLRIPAPARATVYGLLAALMVAGASGSAREFFYFRF
jgi:D-alanyl-lipoteichoic acid acyltransferase DltB (MBOAT superfamily)